MTAAVAIFVKTPGFSPVKTRLAARIGVTCAEHFYRMAIRAIAEVVAGVPGLAPYWAVAEQRAVKDPMWREFHTVAQGPGSLGVRLDRVCRELQASHGRVLMVGADAPQLTAALLLDAMAALDDPSTPFVLGRASDGGFWLFGTRRDVPAAVWNSPAYSSATTCDQLVAALSPLGDIAPLPRLTDVDHCDDLLALSAALHALERPLPAQLALREWLSRPPATKAAARTMTTTSDAGSASKTQRD